MGCAGCVVQGFRVFGCKGRLFGFLELQGFRVLGASLSPDCLNYSRASKRAF